ncbi:MAG: archaeosine biosynthesis radical SAM protein RaSEA [Candidatus Thermoplasmatota archaeon]|nr:archaeosine biosynthesis radical SAM protein RaSEA [Candidatus Thermoplasmatota archaeon]
MIMNPLAEFCHELKTGFIPKTKDPKRPVRVWSEPDRYHDEIINAFVIILRTKGCSWAQHSGCSMCGYFNDSAWDTITSDDIIQQYTTAMASYNKEPVVKIFTSGSFLDTSEVPLSSQDHIFTDLGGKVEKIMVESRPKYITDTRLHHISTICDDTAVELGVGLETANDTIRTHVINKGFSFKDYQQAAETIHKHNKMLKTYVLIKPIFLTEADAINDAIQTTKAITHMTDTISFNPCNVQRNTLTEYLYKKDQYRPPWLWSIIEILRESKHIAPGTRLQCDIAGGGSRRGAHNCKNCDRPVLDAISRFSLTQDDSTFADLTCTCKDQWHDQIELEKMTFGSIVDFSKEVFS